MNTEKIYQLKVTLMYSDPVIWRRIQVLASTSLGALHNILQTTMGWDNAHLHQFIHKKTYYAPDNPWADEDYAEDYEGIQVNHLLTRARGKMQYEYDFGDAWLHEILVEKTLDRTETGQYPICIAGEMACPPEDCGGVWGYMKMLKVLSDPEDEEYEDILYWVGEDFDPKEFDEEKINSLLQTPNHGTSPFFD